MADVDLGLSLYNFNKQAMNQLSILDPIQFNKAVESVANHIFSLNPKYWMLLNNERKDFTIFAFSNNTEEKRKQFISDFKETLNNRGMTVDIDRLEDSDNYEIWMRDPASNENFLYYFFDYSEGIIEI